jgi:hypothetical protein
MCDMCQKVSIPHYIIYRNLTSLIQVEKGRQHGLFAPGFVVKLAIRMIRNSVLKTAEFDIRMLSPIEHADK